LNRRNYTNRLKGSKRDRHEFLTACERRLAKIGSLF
jgi:hypothetical protein